MDVSSKGDREGGDVMHPDGKKSLEAREMSSETEVENRTGQKIRGLWGPRRSEYGRRCLEGERGWWVGRRLPWQRRRRREIVKGKVECVLN